MAELLEKQAVLNCFHGWFDENGEPHTPDEIPVYQAIAALEPVSEDNKVNLCDSCAHTYPKCPAEFVTFGNGPGFDNICSCAEYRPKEQPNVIYCGDCKHYREPSCYIHIERIWELKKTDFCSQGERE